MLHTKKMVLVPQDAIEKMHQIPTRDQIEQTRSVQTPGTTLSRLDAEMDDILRSVTPSNQHEKWKLYQQVLQRYQFFTDEERRPKIITPPATNEKPTEQVTEETDRTTARVTDEVILDTVPKSYKKQAEQLLKHLHSNSNTRLTWDSTGLVRINGEAVKDSNIIDLVNDAMRLRKSKRAIGRQQFGSELRLMGVPREAIGNTSLLYENLTLSPPANTSQSNLFTPNTSRNSLNSSVTGSGKRRTPTSEAVRSWKTLKL